MSKFIKKIINNKVKTIILLFVFLTIVSTIWALIVGEIKWSEWYLILLFSFILTSISIAIPALILFIYFLLGYGKFWEFDSIEDAKEHSLKTKRLRDEIKVLKRTEKHI
jgi:ABC-type amino acid transport system permease subunit